MSDEWMPSLKLNLTRQEFDQLPRHPAYKYELINGITYLSPWPRHYHALLEMGRFHLDANDLGKATLRPLQADDTDALVPIFRDAFARLQPFSSLSDEQRQNAAEQCVQRTFAGDDGLLALPACFVALEGERIIGAIIITLLPGGDPLEWDSCRWQEAPPADLWQNTRGQPHLTWIFVGPWHQGTGVGTQLLRVAVRVLGEQGYATLWSTFLLGNESSMLWHWRNGFTLLPAFLSKRRMRRELKKMS